MEPGDKVEVRFEGYIVEVEKTIRGTVYHVAHDKDHDYLKPYAYVTESDMVIL